jgi:hypothetical protein
MRNSVSWHSPQATARHQLSVIPATAARGGAAGLGTLIEPEKVKNELAELPR